MANPATYVIKLTGFPTKLPNVPPNYPIGPAPGKLQLLLNSNDNYLYHKFSPYTNYHDSLLAPILSNKQPFVYTYIDEAQKGIVSSLPATARYALNDIVNVNQDSVNDVTRVSKFLISSWGVQFLAAQLAIQRLAPFDETRIYNPLSPLIATITPMTAGLGNRPTRHIEPIGSGLLGTALGALNSITSAVGINLQNGYSNPSSTAGDDTALHKVLVGIAGSQGKGMVRGGDAASGLANMQAKWPVNAGKSSSGNIFSNAISNFASNIANSFKSFFGGAPKSKGLVRADDSGYIIMANGMVDLNQGWFSPGAVAAFGKPPTYNKSTFGVFRVIPNDGADFPTTKLFSKADKFEWIDTTEGVVGPIIGRENTGYGVGSKYTDIIGQQPPSSETSVKNSEMLVQYGYYIEDAQNFPTKFSDPDRATKLKNQLQKVVDDINLNKNYFAFNAPSSYLLPNAGADSTYVRYDNWTNKKNTEAQKPGTLGEYQYGSGPTGQRPKSIDRFVRSDPDNLRMSSTFLSDGINLLGVLGKDRKVLTGDTTDDALNAAYPNWVDGQWKPYENDIIAFFFYDVVNDKYIPFRATVKAISEGNTAFWDELRFIGRADQLYSYNGFSRTLSFSFNVVINSVNELLPSWKKINYIASAVKPSNYTTGQIINQKFNRFIVPPMFMLTIGDLYKFQPMVITSININIPDDASWETLNQDNSREWTYLNGIIRAPNLGKNYGQLPREAEIAVTCNLLEKERAIVGGSHFGHEPRVDDWETQSGDARFLTDGSVPYLPSLTDLGKGLAQFNDPGKTTH